MAATEGNPPLALAASPPGTDMTGVCFRDQLWLNTYPLDRNLVLDYFALSPFYDASCNNEALRLRSLHPLDASQLSKMTGTEYALCEASEPHLFVLRKQKREGPDRATPLLSYYVLDGTVYQAPQLSAVFASRITRALYHISSAFSMAAAKLERIGYVDADSEANTNDTKVAKDPIDFRELKRVDHILASLQRKLPPAPPPPPFPEGYIPPSTSEDKPPEETTDRQLTLDPILDQGPSKRIKY